MKKYLMILFLGLSGVASAQDNYFYVNWDVNIPMSNTNWLGASSTRGAKLGYRKFIGAQRRFSAGVDFNWAYYQEYKPTETFQVPGGAITTDYFNDIFQLGIAASGQYYFPAGKGEHFFPYAGLGLGANMSDFTVSYNIYSDQETSWGFLARPEVGILVRIGTRRRLGLMAATHYDYSTSKSVSHDYNSFSNLGFQLGVMMLQM